MGTCNTAILPKKANVILFYIFQNVWQNINFPCTALVKDIFINNSHGNPDMHADIPGECTYWHAEGS